MARRVLLACRMPLLRRACLLVCAAAAWVEASVEERRALREEVRAMFSFAYDSYMASAFPADVLAPFSCAGEDEWGGISMTLLDTLDTLALMGNSTEFERGVRYVTSGSLSFDRDQTVRHLHRHRCSASAQRSNALSVTRRVAHRSRSSKPIFARSVVSSPRTPSPPTPRLAFCRSPTQPHTTAGCCRLRPI